LRYKHSKYISYNQGAMVRTDWHSSERLAQADPGLFMKIEELELPATTKIELNTAAHHSHVADARSSFHRPKGDRRIVAPVT
jgi:hypothetical protein